MVEGIAIISIVESEFVSKLEEEATAGLLFIGPLIEGIVNGLSNK